MAGLLRARNLSSESTATALTRRIDTRAGYGEFFFCSWMRGEERRGVGVKGGGKGEGYRRRGCRGRRKSLLDCCEGRRLKGVRVYGVFGAGNSAEDGAVPCRADRGGCVCAAPRPGNRVLILFPWLSSPYSLLALAAMRHPTGMHSSMLLPTSIISSSV